jgi:hypothetical protein
MRQVLRGLVGRIEQLNWAATDGQAYRARRIMVPV